MPVYAYRCETCGKHFDHRAPMDAPAPPCPECGSGTRKVYQVIPLHFKGSGFYQNDNATNKENSV